MKRTLQLNNRHRAKTHGFRARMKAGTPVITKRRLKGRHKLAL